MPVTFLSNRPASSVGRGFRFRGGRLTVSDEQAETVRAAAALHPELGIVEESAVYLDRLTKAELVEIATERGLSGEGTRADIIERLEA